MRNRRQESEGRECKIARRIAMSVVGVCVALVAVNTGALMIFNPETVARRELESLARDYYENYYHGQIRAENFGEYAENGFPSTQLRVLLTYAKKNGRDLDYIFDKVGCNAVQTEVFYLPREPYSASDYDLKIKYSCNFE